MKKLISEPTDVVEEMLEGMVASEAGLQRLADTDVIVRLDAPVEGKVGVVTGGGSGHEPMHAGYVGEGMLDGAATGAIFTSPPATDIQKMIESADSGEGVLAIIKNYEGDLMNFDTAAELADVEYEQVVVNDDVAVSEAEDRTGCRGVAGTVFAHKIAGAMADRGEPLIKVKRVAEKVIDDVASMCVALSSCITPERGEPTVELGATEIELGIGIHGEPGVERTELQPADEITNRLTADVLNDLDMGGDNEVAVMINGLGGTPLSEIYCCPTGRSDPR